jgi:hypothetical protein
MSPPWVTQSWAAKGASGAGTQIDGAAHDADAVAAPWHPTAAVLQVMGGKAGTPPSTEHEPLGGAPASVMMLPLHVAGPTLPSG